MRIPDFQLERYFAQWEFTAPHLLCASDIEGYPLSDLLALADPECQYLWETLTLGYTESAGLPLLRQAIAATYQNIEPDHILTFVGAEEAIFVLMNTLLQPGDHAIVTWPGYQSLYEIAQSCGADVTLLPLDPDAGWALDMHKLRQAIRPTTRLLVTNFPHNPTGALINHATFHDLVSLVDEADITWFSDEVYRLLEYHDADRLPTAASCTPRAVSLGVMSKAYGLAGLRVGWLATRNHTLLRQAAAFKDYLSICGSAPSEILALIALRAQEKVLARSRGILAHNLVLLDDFFARRKGVVDWVRPRAGSVAFPRLCLDTPIAEVATTLREREGVLILPSTVYDYPGNHFRIGFGRTTMAEALIRMECGMTLPPSMG